MSTEQSYQERVGLGVLGGTGMAGREAVLHQAYLEERGEDYAELQLVSGSSDSAGRRLGEVFNEKEDALASSYGFWDARDCPEQYADLRVTETAAGKIADEVDYVISALPSSVARDVEPALRDRGVHVFSNASAARWDADVPLMLPEVNGDHITYVAEQETTGKQVNNPNCTTAGFVPVLHALQDDGYSIDSVDVHTMQSVSGKGDTILDDSYRRQMQGNVRDDWDMRDTANGEEYKSETEPQKILGNLDNPDAVEEAYRQVRNGAETELLPINARTNRVPTQFGHLETVTLTFSDDTNVDDVKQALAAWRPGTPVDDLPSAPDNTFHVQEERPEPRYGTFADDGMGIVVGGFRKYDSDTVSLYTLSHNLRKGATWTARECMELYMKEYNDTAF